MGIMRDTDTSKEQSRKDTRHLERDIYNKKKREKQERRRRRQDKGRIIAKEIEKRKREKEEKEKAEEKRRKYIENEIKKGKLLTEKVKDITKKNDEINKKKRDAIVNAGISVYIGNVSGSVKYGKEFMNIKGLPDYQKRYVEKKKLLPGFNYNERSARIARGRETGVVKIVGSNVIVDEEKTKELIDKVNKEKEKKKRRKKVKKKKDEEEEEKINPPKRELKSSVVIGVGALLGLILG